MAFEFGAVPIAGVRLPCIAPSAVCSVPDYVPESVQPVPAALSLAAQEPKCTIN